MACNGNDKPASGGITPAAPAKPQIPQAVLDMLRAVELGPTGYNDAMRVNVGVDEPGTGTQTSAMMGTAPSFTGYQPTPFKPDPLAPALPRDTTTPLTMKPEDIGYGVNWGAAPAQTPPIVQASSRERSKYTPEGGAPLRSRG